MFDMGSPYSIGPNSRNAALERLSEKVASEGSTIHLMGRGGSKRGSLPCFMPVCEPPFGAPPGLFQTFSQRFSVRLTHAALCMHTPRRMVCSTARICLACMGQCHRNPLSEE